MTSQEVAGIKTLTMKSRTISIIPQSSLAGIHDVIHTPPITYISHVWWAHVHIMYECSYISLLLYGAAHSQVYNCTHVLASTHLKENSQFFSSFSSTRAMHEYYNACKMLTAC